MKKRSILLLLILLTFSVIAQVKTPPDWSKDAVIYEVNLRQFSEEGTFEAFQKHLPRLKSMGVDILWFMPIHPIGEKNRKGTLGSYYAVKDYFDVNPEHGTKEDFRELVDQIHKMGMYVIIDWVANHTAWDNELTVTNPDFFTKDSAGNFIPPVADWHDVIDLNYDNKEVWTYMTSALKYWVDEFTIDGYRCDVAGMVPTEFWNQAVAELQKSKEVFMLAEASEPELHSAFDMTYSWEFHNIMNDIPNGKKNADDVEEYFKKDKSEFPKSAYRMMFTSNHDENSWKGTVFERMGDAAEIMLVLSSVVEGMPLVYSGQEAGLNKRLDFFEKDIIEWKEHKFYDLYSELFSLKEKNKALWNGEFGGEMEFIDNSNEENVTSFIREKDNKKVFAVFNLSKETQSVKLNDERIKGSYINLFTKQPSEIFEEMSFELNPWEYIVLYK
jgi:1,4-alpha-glucan branching enzyme